MDQRDLMWNCGDVGTTSALLYGGDVKLDKQIKAAKHKIKKKRLDFSFVLRNIYGNNRKL